MKKFSKFLALGLAGASALTGGFMLAGCDATNDNDNTQTSQDQDEQKEVSSISINADSLPSYIIKEKFARTNIKATVTYVDNTTKVIDVTESMLDATSKEKIKNVGQYNLTVNYGDKTSTMYANVVDERYLLLEVVKANVGKDLTMTSDESVIKLDTDNKIVYRHDTEDDYTFYGWVGNNCSYDYDSDEGVCEKSLISNINAYMTNTFDMFCLEDSMVIDGVDRDGGPWTFKSIEKDANNNYVLTADWYGTTMVYTFNEDFLLKIYEDENDGYTCTTEYDYSPVTLEVPAEIKALETSATIDVESRIDDLKWGTIESYLKSDFEMSIFDNASNTTYLFQKYDADNKILLEIDSGSNEAGWKWVSGDYYYSYSDEGIYKYDYDVSNWDRDIMVNCFTFDEAFDAERITVDISEDGQYYELILTSEDYDGEVWEYKYVFNDTEIAKVDVKCDEEYMGTCTYNKTNIVLEVPAEIKALESSAQ